MSSLGRDTYGATGVNYTYLDASASPRNSCHYSFIARDVRREAPASRAFLWPGRLLKRAQRCDNDKSNKSESCGVTVLGWLSVLIVWSLASVTGLILSVILVSPSGIGPLGVTIWFVVLFLALAAAVTLALYSIKSFLHLHATSVSRLRYSWRQGLLVGGWVSGVLALSSVRQLGLLDGILLALLLGIVEVYVRFRWP
jgi:hypothetical protein